MISNVSFLLNIRPFMYYSLYIIIIILLTVSMVTNNLSSFVSFYLSLIISVHFSNLILYLLEHTDEPCSSSISFYNPYLLFMKESNKYFLPLFVFAYTISYIVYTAISVQQIILSQMYIIIGLLMYFISIMSYIIVCTPTLIKKECIVKLILYILGGLMLGLVFAYLIEHYINYQFLFFSTYKARNTQWRCTT